jgi:plastocyanin
MLARRGAVVQGVCAAVLTVASAAACAKAPINRPGNSGSGTASLVNGVQQITLTAGDDYRFHPATFTVHPGKVDVVLRNTGAGAPHEFEVTGFPATFVPLTPAGQTQHATFTAPPLTNGKTTRYEFVCGIHVRQGQVGTMIVTPG